jgi:hypothetical protein
MFGREELQISIQFVRSFIWVVQCTNLLCGGGGGGGDVRCCCCWEMAVMHTPSVLFSFSCSSSSSSSSIGCKHIPGTGLSSGFTVVVDDPMLLSMVVDGRRKERCL